ncbi:MAG: tetratricopeptide repeat protein, partial [Bacteroidia bacterium]
FEIRVTSRSLSWEEPEGTAEAFPWGMYVKEGQTNVLDWKIPPAPKKNVLGIDLPNANWLKIAVISLVFMAVSALGYGLYSIGEDKSWWERAENPNQEQKPFCKRSLFKSDNNYNVLLLEMGQEEKRSKILGNIRDGLSDLETLSKRNQDRSGIEIKEINEYLGNDDKENTEFLCSSCGADMVIWGQYEKQANSILLYLYYLTKNQAGETLFLKQEAGDLERNLGASIELIKKDKGHLRPLRNTMLWAAGYKNYEKEPQLALPFWKRLAEELPEKGKNSLSNPSPALFGLAYAYMDSYDKDSQRAEDAGYPEEVLSHLDNAIAFDSTFQPAHYYRGEYHYSHKSLQAAFDDFEKASKLSTPTSLGAFFQGAFDVAKRFAQVGSELIEQLFKNKDFDGAKASLNRLGNYKPTGAEQYFKIARLNHDLRTEIDSVKALKYYNAAIEQNPQFADAHLQRGKLFQEEYRNYDSAYLDFSRVVELEPENFWGYLHRGYLNMDFLKDREAIADYEKGIELKERKSISVLGNEYGNLAKLYGRRRYTSPQDSINHFPNDSAQFARFFKLANSGGRKFRKASLGQKVVRRYDEIITTILTPAEQP